MARKLLLALSLPTIFQAGLALLMCASHSHRWRRRWNACTDFFDDGPVVQHIQPGNYDATSDEQEEDSVWQKNILMGGKCQLPDFSGVIIYDAEGNIVKPDKTPRLTWS